MIYLPLPYDKDKVSAKLKQKKYDDLFLRGRGRLDDFVAFLYQTGILALFESITSPMERKPEIPRRFLHYCLCLKPAVEAASINQLPSRLFEDTDTLQELGFTIEEIKDGFSVKNKEGKNIPVNINAFYDELERLPEAETKRFFQGGVILFKDKRFLRKKEGVYALDAVKLLITGTKKYENFGRITYRKNGELIKEKGYKLVFIQKVDGDDYFVVAAVLLPLNAHESTVAERLVEEALAILGSSAINILLFDRGFLGGEFFDFLDDKKIHFVCPTRDDQHLTRHMQGLHRTGEEVKTILPDETILAGYDHLIKMESCQRKINGVLILKQTKKSRKQVKEGKEFGFLTSLPTSYSSQIERVYSLYSRRWKIETNGNRELKQGWYLNNFPSRSWNGISAHIYFTLFMFNVITAYKSGQGRALTEKGIVSLRHKHFKPFPHQPEVTATADGYTATYSLGEFAELFGLPPPSGKHRNSRWGRLPDGRRALFVLKESLLGD